VYYVKQSMSTYSRFYFIKELILLKILIATKETLCTQL
jgi:hypothetical protein